MNKKFSDEVFSVHGMSKHKQYQVVSHWSVAAYPRDICQISSSGVAVAMPDGVQFITVTQSHLKVIQSRFLKDHHQSQIGFQSSSGLSDMLSQEGERLTHHTLVGVRQVLPWFSYYSGSQSSSTRNTLPS
ncbi:hypothetical protein DPMN_073103 [Dreissena polymorpha]|uniref:Uncharacterized protein n=1 Tax=Dreissena polymorpha TaxID=45954 RepID=A0A9D4BYJ8_DREPO|nr:hypothetical protein DPMN_073103 [Dreissena polymorpha]